VARFKNADRLLPLTPNLKEGAMPNSAIIAAAGLSMLLGISTASADALDNRAKELLPWVAQRTGYAADHVKVTVILVEPRTIDLIAYRVSKDGDPKPEAITAGATIFLPTTFELGANDDILVHELTHVLQYENDAKFRCRAEQEKQAYEVQAAFVDETGIGTKPDPFFMFMLHCTAYAVHNPTGENVSR
jgi:Domain of unknown function (DUF4157)